METNLIQQNVQKSDKAMEYSAAPGDLQEAEYYSPSLKEVCTGCCCSGRCCALTWSVFAVCLICAILAGLFTKGLLGWIVGSGFPFIILAVYASQIFGGDSVDKGQTCLVIFLHTLLFAFLLIIILPFARQPMMRAFANIDRENDYCMYKSVQLGIFGKDQYPKHINITAITPKTMLIDLFPRSELEAPCWGLGLSLGFGGALPEETIKILTIGAFISRGWVADPFAVLVYSFVIGTTFGFLENSSYTVAALASGNIVTGIIGVLIRTLQAQTILHGSCASMSGLFMAQRKFLFWKSHGEASCCELGGPRPTWLVVVPAIYFHFMNNFIAAGQPPLRSPLTSFIIFLITYGNLVVMVQFVYYLWLTLKNVPRINIINLEKIGAVPKALAYICCCGCCNENVRDRRYESVLNMVDMGGEDEYLPPTIVEA